MHNEFTCYASPHTHDYVEFSIYSCVLMREVVCLACIIVFVMIYIIKIHILYFVT